MEQEQQTTRERVLRFISGLVPEWRPTPKQKLWVIRIIIVLIFLSGLLVLIGLPFGITLWEWLKLLIVPAVIAAGGIWFNRQQRDRELQIAEQRAQDDALQSYLDGMTEPLTDKDRPLQEARPGDSVSTVARARTLSVLTRLEDGNRRGSVVQFLYESGLISTEAGLVIGRTIISLDGCDLSGVVLQGVKLHRADLSGADLGRAELSTVNLSQANLRRANLNRAKLTGTNLGEAKLSEADLSEAVLSPVRLGVGRTTYYYQGTDTVPVCRWHNRGMPKILYPQVITEDPRELKKLEKQHRYTHLFQRVRMLRLLKSGECSNLSEAADALGYSWRQCQRWFASYRDGGLKELLTSRVDERGRQELVTPEAFEELQERGHEEGGDSHH